MARMSGATVGYDCASSSRLPISTSAGTTPGHSVLAPRNQQPLPTRRAGMERIARNKKLHPLSRNDVRRNNNMPDLAIAPQHEHFERIAELIVIELIISDAVKAHGRFGCHKEV